MGQRQSTSYCLHGKCAAAPKLGGRGCPALPWEQYWVRPAGEKDAGGLPSFSSCPSSPHILPPYLHLWPGSDRTQQTGKDALTAKKCSEFKLNPKANLTSVGVWSLALRCLSWSGYVLCSSRRSCLGCEIRSGAGLAGSWFSPVSPHQKGSQGICTPTPDVSGVSCISAVTSFPLMAFPQTLWTVPMSKPH